MKSSDIAAQLGGSQEPEQDYGWEDYVRPGLQGMTAGFADEIGAGVATIPAMIDNISNNRGMGVMDTYKDIRNSIRGQESQFARDNPIYNVAANMVGGAMTGGAGAGKAMGTAWAGANPMKTLALTGAAEGGLVGLGESSADTLSDDAINTIVGAGIGSILTPVMSKTVGGVVDLLRSNPTSQAGRKLMRAMDDDGISIEEMEEFLAQNPTSFPVDMPQASGLRGQGVALGRTPGKSKKYIEEALEGRQRQMEPQIRESLSRNTGGRTDVYGASDAASQQAKDTAGPLYRQSFTTSEGTPRHMDMTRNMMDIEDDKQFSKAISNAKSAYKRKYGIPPQGTEVEYWHQVKRGLNSDIRKMQRAGENEYAADIINVKKGLYDDMTSQVGSYDEANQIWSGTESMKDAMGLGRKVLVKDADDPDIIGLTGSEKKMFINGASRAILDKFEGGPASANEARNLIKSTRFKERMRNAFPDDKSFDRFIGDMDRLTREGMSRSRISPMENSVTSEALAEIDSLSSGDIVDVGVELANANPMGAAKAAVRAASSSKTGQIAPEVGEQMSSALFSNDPAALKQSLMSGAGIGLDNRKLQAVPAGLMTGGRAWMDEEDEYLQ